MKYVKYGIAALALIIAATAFSFQPQAFTESAFLLDTYISVTVYGGEKEAAKAAVLRTAEVDAMLSCYNENSEISAINRAKANEPVSVSEECFLLIKRALSLSKATGGAFDITLKPVTDEWDFGGSPKVPKDENLEKALKSVGYQYVLLDESKKTVTLLKENMALDLGAIAKGYAADEAMEVLKNAGVSSAVLDFGGNVVTIGEMPLSLWESIKTFRKNRPFTIGIQDPEKPRGTVLKTVTAASSPCAVVTSGGYERFFTENGKTYHHILDPETGRQPTHNLASVSVVASCSETADALSTALFVSGPKGADAVADLYETVIFVYENGEIITK